MRLVRALVVALTTLTMFGPLAAHAGDFTPTIQFELSDARVKANPQLKVSVAQEEGEEELASVSLTIPKGFSLPPDEAIANDDQLGSGTININVGPGCRPDSPAPQGKAPAELPATLKERDRTDDETQAGVYAVWVLDISGVTKIDLSITGSKKTGWVLAGEIPPNDNTCPAFSFDLNINSQSTTGGVPILVNPKKPGKAVFSATFTSADSPAHVTLTQKIKITK
jgi:hypothetical protein